MKISEKLIRNIEDFARVRDFLDSLCCAIENNSDMPNFIPMCNDGMLTDQLTKIAEKIGNMPVWKPVKKGERTPCRCYLMKPDGEMIGMPTGEGVIIGQDCYYLNVEDLKKLEKA